MVKKEVETRPLRVIKTMWPAQAGAVKLTRRYGDALVCVRYRHDPDGQTRYTTVELVVEAAPIQRRPTDRTIVCVQIKFTESKLRENARQQGANWDAKARLWRMPMGAARKLGIVDRIQKDWR